MPINVMATEPPEAQLPTPLVTGVDPALNPTSNPTLFRARVNSTLVRTHLQSLYPSIIFIFKSKHKQPDKFCGRFCNPARWIELTDEHTGQLLFQFVCSKAGEIIVWRFSLYYTTHARRLIGHYWLWFCYIMLNLISYFSFNLFLCSLV